MNCIKNCKKFLREHGYYPTIRDGRNGTYYCIDIPRHDDDFWETEEYKECKKILGDNFIEGFYGCDTYTLFVRRNEENGIKESEQPEVDLEREIQEHIKECLDVKFPTTDIELIKKDVAYTARKFYELGINARKEE